MSEVERRLITSGSFCDVECAVLADGITSPSATFLDQLAAGTPDPTSAPDMEMDEQINSADWIEAACAHLAGYGGFPGPRDHNQLRDGIWEIKHLNIRMTFYDTDGYGRFDPKINFEGSGFFGMPPGLPDLDEYVRLATGFIKPPSVRKTPPYEISRARAVRREDISHDRV